MKAEKENRNFTNLTHESFLRLVETRTFLTEDDFRFFEAFPYFFFAETMNQLQMANELDGGKILFTRGTAIPRATHGSRNVEKRFRFFCFDKREAREGISAGIRYGAILAIDFTVARYERTSIIVV